MVALGSIYKPRMNRIILIFQAHGNFEDVWWRVEPDQQYGAADLVQAGG